MSVTEPSRLTTLNRMGRTSAHPNEYSLEFIEFAASCALPALDIGAAFGVATIPALAAGATVIANDLEPQHLAILRDRTPARDVQRLVLAHGRFPDDLEFAPNSLGAVHASNVLNFLRGSEIQRGAELIAEWLAPAGRVFIVAGTPYARNVEATIAKYESRKRSGIVWPGEFEPIQAFSSDATLDVLPGFLHLLDDEVLIDVLARVGLIIERAELFERANLPAYLRLDGRENVGVVARKP